MTDNFGRVCTVLRERRRRKSLLLLRDGEVDTQAELAGKLADDYDEVEVLLTHVDLPRMADAGYIEWDRETGRIARGPRFGVVQQIIDLFEAHADEIPCDWP